MHDEHIVIGDLKSHINGELYFLKQRAFSNRYFDLVGNIERAAANIWLHEGNSLEALKCAQAAAECYQIDGCPEDKAISVALVAIAQLNYRNQKAAIETINSIHIKTGRIVSYLEIFKSLLIGKTPELAVGHPLHGVKWNVQPRIKENSIPGKIYFALQGSPASRDSLIKSVWGEDAIDPSYNSRLYTAINELRKKYGVEVNFDGEQYKIS